MGLFSFLRRDRSAANDPAPRGRRAGDLPSADVVRTQARRRLIGAAVLVVAAVLVLPWVFDSKPRPLPVDIPIDVPKRDLSVALPEPPPRRVDERVTPPAPSASLPAPALAVDPAPASMPVQPKEPEPKASEHKAPESKVQAPKVEAPKPPKVVEERKPKPSEPVKPPPKPEPKPAKPVEAEKPAKSTTEAERAKAALEGRDAAAAGNTRFVVQVGAFEQADGAKEARQRVAKAGLSAHESAVQTADGKRIRVRVGPFASREEAEKAAAKLRAAGLGGAVMPQ